MSVLFLSACSVRANPLYCDESADCNVGTTCNVSTHTCDEVADAGVVDQLATDARLVATSVHDLRDPEIPNDTWVELSEVVVTAIDHGIQIWVEDPGGGPGTGVHVVGGVLAEVNALAVGDVIAVTTARKQTFATPNRGVRVRQRAGQVLGLPQSGTTMMPTVTTMDAGTLASLGPDQLLNELDRFAGSLVVVRLVRATGPIDGFNRLSIGPLFVSSQLSPLPPQIDTGTCFVSITGILDYADGYTVFPRSMDDIVLGSGCN